LIGDVLIAKEFFAAIGVVDLAADEFVFFV
jgi:hypothetical protein